MDYTIAALATPFAASGLGIIRISGKEAKQIAMKVFTPRGNRHIDNVKGFSAILGRVYDSEGIFDDAIATVFTAPKSYTGEDVVELSCHGGTYILQRLLAALYTAGATAAGAGEFTKRAFLNGKLSLDEAEGVMDIISAQSKLSLTAAYNAKEGALHRRLDRIIANLTHKGAHLAAWIDYPEEDIEELDPMVLNGDIKEIHSDLSNLLQGYDQGRIIREGILTAIVGKPNVGKSTLMNCLTGVSTSIVTPVAGTTRDIVEETVLLDDLTLRLSDTAGIRDTEDLVESIGVENARKKITGSNIVFAVFDGSSPLSGEDHNVLDLVKGLPAIAVINKTDLDNIIDIEYIKQYISHIVYISAANSQGIKDLSQMVKDICCLNHIDSSSGMIYNQRQKHHVQTAVTACEECISALEMGATLDAITICIEDILSPLLELTGKKASEQVVDGVFSQFCVGK